MRFRLLKAPAAGMIGAVTWFKKSVVLLLLVLWGPVTMHCSLETVSGLSFLQSCCGGDETAQSSGDCAEDLCSAVESGFYKIEDHPTLAPVPALVLTFASWEWPSAAWCESAAHPAPACLAPPEWLRPWQFSSRAALPPRAPSSVA